jgi:transketolase
VGGLGVLRATDADRAAVVAAGITLHEALAAHAELGEHGIATRVVDLYSVKPVDVEGLRATARAVGGRILVVEDHYAEGGLGDAVRGALAPVGVAVHHLAVREVPRSGPPRLLLERHGIGRAAIVAAVRALVEA